MMRRRIPPRAYAPAPAVEQAAIDLALRRARERLAEVECFAFLDTIESRSAYANVEALKRLQRGERGLLYALTDGLTLVRMEGRA